MPGLVTREKVWVNVSPSFKCWRLVYNSISKKVFILFEKEGLTKTLQSMFCSDRTDGTPGSIPSEEGRQQCLAVIAALKLIVPGKTQW